MTKNFECSILKKLPWLCTKPCSVNSSNSIVVVMYDSTRITWIPPAPGNMWTLSSWFFYESIVKRVNAWVKLKYHAFTRGQPHLEHWFMQWNTN